MSNDRTASDRARAGAADDSGRAADGEQRLRGENGPAAWRRVDLAESAIRAAAAPPGIQASSPRLARESPCFR